MTERKLLALSLAVVISTAAVAGVGTNALLSDSESVPVAFSGNVSGNVDTGQLQSAGNEGPIIQTDSEEYGTVTQTNETETQINETETQSNETETTDTITKSEELSSTDVAAPGTTADTEADQ